MPRKKALDTEAEKIRNRAKEMIRQRPSHKEVLEFYRDVVIEQNSALSKIKTSPIEIDKKEAEEKILHGFPLVEKKAFILDIPSAMKLFKRLCKILSKTKKGHHDAERITNAIKKKEFKLPELFKKVESEDEEYVISLSERLHINPDIISFLITNSIKPIYESYSKGLKEYIDQERWWRGYCPVCGSEPYIAELKNEGGVEGARFLVCSSCGFEWRFNRLKCPFCENGDHEKLKYFYTEKEGRGYRVDVCDNCKRYIKTIDTKSLGIEFIPALEDIGTLHLDILAQKEGYTKEGKGLGLETNA